MKIKLGTVVRDKVTGLVGVAENRATFLYGCDRYCVQPKAKDDGTVPDAAMVDEPQLEIVEGEERRMTPIGDPERLIELGQLVEDPVRGMTGTAIGRAVYLNGCSRVCVAPKQFGDKHIDNWWVDERQLISKKGLGGGVKKTVETKPHARKSGGPAPSSSKY